MSMKILKPFLIVFPLIMVGALIALGSIVIYNRYQHYIQDEINFHAAIAIVKYNMDHGVLKVPPELMPLAAPPATTQPAPQVAPEKK